MNGYVDGSTAYKYEGNCIELERAQRWLAHRRAQMEMQEAKNRAAACRRAEARNRKFLVIEMVLRCATAILLLVSMCIETIDAWNILWTNGLRGNLSEVMMMAAGIALSVWILNGVSRRAEEIMDEIAPNPEDEERGIKHIKTRSATAWRHGDDENSTRTGG